MDNNVRAGLQLFYPNGEVNIDTSTGLPRYLGVANPNGASWSGSLYVPEWRTHRPWFIAQPDKPVRLLAAARIFVWADKDNATLNWNIIPHSQFGSAQFIYGCY